MQLRIILHKIYIILCKMSMCMCLCVCVSFISITQKQITAVTSNLVFYICVMTLNFLYRSDKNSVHRGIQNGGNFLLLDFCIFRLH